MLGICWVLRIVKCRSGDENTLTTSHQLYGTFISQLLNRSQECFPQPLKGKNELHLSLKTCLGAYVRRELRVGGNSSSIAACSGIVYQHRMETKEKNTPVLALLVDGKVGLTPVNSSL